MDQSLLEIGARIGVFYIPFLFALCFHEFAHGWVARLRGDNTAEMMGRLTMNPVAHMDIIGTVILPLLAVIFPTGIFFGWAKPVPVNPRNLKNVRTDMFWVALAGPMSNILLAVVGAFLMGLSLRYLASAQSLNAILEILKTFILTNLFLAIFNAIPLHPLDGGKILARFLPAQLNYKLEQNEHVTSIILLFLMLAGVLKILVYPVQGIYQLLVQIFVY